MACETCNNEVDTVMVEGSEICSDCICLMLNVKDVEWMGVRPILPQGRLATSGKINLPVKYIGKQAKIFITD